MDTCVNRCTIVGEHLSWCIGIVGDGQGGVKACTGCLPQPTERGVLCWSCAAKVDELWSVLPDLVPHLRSIEKGPTVEGAHTRSAPGSRVIVPPSWLEADNLWTALHVAIVAVANERREDEPDWMGGTSPWGFGSRDSIDTVMVNVWDATFWLLSRTQTAHDAPIAARRLTGLCARVSNALKRFPLEERAHLVEHVRCRKCELVTLEWQPPLAESTPVVVRCLNEKCGAVYDPVMIQYDLRQLREQLEAAKKLLAA